MAGPVCRVFSGGTAASLGLGQKGPSGLTQQQGQYIPSGGSEGLATVLNALWETCDAGLAVLDLEGTILSANSKLCHLAGREPDQLRSSSVLSLLPPGERLHALSATQRILTGESESERLRLQLRVSGEQNTPIRANLEGICNEAGQIESVLLVAWPQGHLPATSSRKPRRARAVASTLHKVLEAVDCPAYELDADLKIRWANQLAHGMREDLVGKPCQEALEVANPSCLQCPARLAQKTGQVQVQHHRRPADRLGQERFYEVVCVPVAASGSQGPGVLLMMRDTTPRVRLHHAQRIEAVGRLAGGVAHDFRNQLTVISGYCQLLLRDLDPQDPNRSAIGEILQAANRSCQVTEHLLTFSRREVLEPRQFDVNDALATLRNPLSKLIGEDVQVQVLPAGQPATILADQALFEQAIVNLALNARDAMAQGGKLVIEVDLLPPDRPEQQGDLARKQVRITVRDTGQGMAEHVRSRAAEPFFTTKDPSQGTGLGLAMVTSFVHQSDGQMDIQSAPGQGCSVRIFLPACPGPAPQDSPESLDELPAGSETILLVEDEPAVARLVCRVLGKCGYQVLQAADPSEAMRLASTHDGPIDLLLTDVVMPGTSGMELSRQLSQKQKHLKVLFISGYSDRVSEAMTHIEPDRLLTKPFSTASLVRTVRRSLDQD